MPMVKIQRWEEKLFNALIDPNENVVNKRFIETQMVMKFLK